MAWLVRDGKVLATIEVAEGWRGRTKGLLGRDGIEGAILLRPARSIHTFRMRFPIDVAFCDRDLRVVKVVTLVPNRMTLPVRRARSAIECEAGMLRRWGVVPGVRLEVRGEHAGGQIEDGIEGIDEGQAEPAGPRHPAGPDAADDRITLDDPVPPPAPVEDRSRPA